MFKFYGNSSSKKQNSSSSSNDKTDNLTNDDNTDIYDNKNESCNSQLFGKRKVLSSHQLLTSSKNDSDIVPNFMSINEIKYVFSLLDVNCDGQVELKEMSEMLTNLGVPIANEALDYILSSASRKGESKICEQEFCDWIARFVGIEPNDRRVTSQAATSLREKSNLLGTKTSLTSSSCQQLVAPIDEATAELAACSSPSERRRRGSGSGNALLRSLSSSSCSLTGVGLTSKEEATTSSSKSETLCQRRKGSVSGKFGSSSSKSKKSSSSKDNNKLISDAEADLRAAFCVFDIDGDGYMTIDEVEAALKLMGENWSQAELRNIFSTRLKNSDSSKQQQHITTTTTTTSISKQKKTTTTATTNNQESRISIDEFVKHLL